MLKVIVLLTSIFLTELTVRLYAGFTPYYQCLSFDLVMHLHNPNPYRVNIVPEIVAHDRNPCFVHRFTHSTILYKSDLHIQAYIVKYKKKPKRKKLGCCAYTQIGCCGNTQLR